GQVQIWKIPDPQHPGTLKAIAAGPSGTEAVAASPRVSIVAMVPANRHTDRSFHANVNPGETAGLGEPAGLCDLSDPTHPRLLAALAGNTTDAAGSAAFDSNGTLLATGSAGNTGQLWNVTDPGHPRQIATLTGHTQPVTAVAFTPDGHTLITGSA